MSLSTPTYVRNTTTGHVGRDTGVGGQRICVDGVWHDRTDWVPATFDEWRAQHPIGGTP